MTGLIPQVVPLGDRLADRAGDAGIWRRTGRAIRRFHDAGVVHADLNARNILLGADDAIHLVDFDRARFSAGNKRAFAANLSRLRRSLEKLWPAPQRDRLDECWLELVAGYDGGIEAA
jgi:3-deoxy-D-manno-octulosonic acid kinase